MGKDAPPSVSVWGSIIALIWEEIPTTKIYIYIIHLGLRRPPIDSLAHNNQPKTGGVVRRVGRDGATIRERVGYFVALIWEEI